LEGVDVGSGRRLATDVALSGRVTAEALIALPEMLAPSVSPDGRWVAWTWLGRDPIACVYAAPTTATSRRAASHPARTTRPSNPGRRQPALILALTDAATRRCGCTACRSRAAPSRGC